jgi:hypothetical protein
MCAVQTVPSSWKTRPSNRPIALAAVFEQYSVIDVK